MALQSSHRE